jgi:hypothetical protein
MTRVASGTSRPRRAWLPAPGLLLLGCALIAAPGENWSAADKELRAPARRHFDPDAPGCEEQRRKRARSARWGAVTRGDRAREGARPGRGLCSVPLASDPPCIPPVEPLRPRLTGAVFAPARSRWSRLRCRRLPTGPRHTVAASRREPRRVPAARQGGGHQLRAAGRLVRRRGAQLLGGRAQGGDCGAVQRVCHAAAPPLHGTRAARRVLPPPQPPVCAGTRARPVALPRPGEYPNSDSLACFPTPRIGRPRPRAPPARVPRCPSARQGAVVEPLDNSHDVTARPEPLVAFRGGAGRTLWRRLPWPPPCGAARGRGPRRSPATDGEHPAHVSNVRGPARPRCTHAGTELLQSRRTPPHSTAR